MSKELLSLLLLHKLKQADCSNLLLQGLTLDVLQQLLNSTFALLYLHNVSKASIHNLNIWQAFSPVEANAPEYLHITEYLQCLHIWKLLHQLFSLPYH